MIGRVSEIQSRMKYCVLMVLIVVIVALVLSWGVQIVQQILKIVVHKIRKMPYKGKE